MFKRQGQKSLPKHPTVIEIHPFIPVASPESWEVLQSSCQRTVILCNHHENPIAIFLLHTQHTSWLPMVCPQGV